MDSDYNKKLHTVVEWLQGEYAGIRSGQASPALLDRIKIEQYGAMVPLVQVGTVGIENARTLRVSIWDSSSIASVEKAIIDADLGVSVATDSSGLRVIFPELTSERREQITKLAKTKLEEARVRVRAVRDEAMKDIETQKKDGDISEDALFTEKDKIQAAVDTTNKKLDALYSAKEAELSI